MKIKVILAGISAFGLSQIAWLHGQRQSLVQIHAHPTVPKNLSLFVLKIDTVIKNLL